MERNARAHRVGDLQPPAEGEVGQRGRGQGQAAHVPRARAAAALPLPVRPAARAVSAAPPAPRYPQRTLHRYFSIYVEVSRSRSHHNRNKMILSAF